MIAKVIDLRKILLFLRIFYLPISLMIVLSFFWLYIQQTQNALSFVVDNSLPLYDSIEGFYRTFIHSDGEHVYNNMKGGIVVTTLLMLFIYDRYAIGVTILSILWSSLYIQFIQQSIVGFSIVVASLTTLLLFVLAYVGKQKITEKYTNIKTYVYLLFMLIVFVYLSQLVIGDLLVLTTETINIITQSSVATELAHTSGYIFGVLLGIIVIYITRNTSINVMREETTTFQLVVFAVVGIVLLF